MAILDIGSIARDGSFLTGRADTTDARWVQFRNGYPARRVHVILDFLDALEAKAP